MEYDPDGYKELFEAIVRQWWHDAQRNGAALASFVAFTGWDRERLARYARRPLPEPIEPVQRATPATPWIRPDVRDELAPLRCQGCFRQFTPANRRQVYCSGACRVAAHRRRRHEATGSDRASSGGDGGGRPESGNG